jgi:hypothetical protein
MVVVLKSLNYLSAWDELTPNMTFSFEREASDLPDGLFKFADNVR